MTKSETVGIALIAWSAVCPNCGKSIEKGGHYMPPCMGDEGMWRCDQFNKLNEEAELAKKGLL